MKKLLALILTLVLCVGLLAGCGSDKKDTETAQQTDQTAPKYTVGICQLVPHEALDNATRGFQDGMIAVLGEGNVEFLLQNAQGDSTTCTTIVNDFVTKKVDLIMGNATAALQAAANGTMEIPVLGTSITEYGVALGIENFNGLVGGNVSGASDLAPLDEQAALITDLFPQAQTVALLYCSAEPNSDYQVKKIREYLEAAGLTCVDYAFADSNDIVAVATAAASNADVIYIPTDNTAASCAESINGAVLPIGTPIVGGDAGICRSCGVVTLTIDYYDMGYATGEIAARILKGELNIAEQPIIYAEATKVYNPVNCAELGIDTAALEAAGFVSLGE